MSLKSVLQHLAHTSFQILLMNNHLYVCLNNISVFCRHSSYYITYTVASFVNMFSLVLPRTETNQQLICRMVATRTACAWLSKDSNQDWYQTTHSANGEPDPKNFCSATSFWSYTRFTFQSQCCSDVMGMGQGGWLRNQPQTQQKPPKLKTSEPPRFQWGAGMGLRGHCAL